MRARSILATVVLALALVREASAFTTFLVNSNASLTTANSNAVAGDVIQFQSGSGPYTTAPVPARSGTAGNYIRYVGSISAPTSFSFSGGLTIASRSYVSWAGLRFQGTIAFNTANACSVSYCRADSGSLIFEGNPSSPTDTSRISSANVVSDCVVNRGVIGPNVFQCLVRCAQYNTVQRCRFTASMVTANAESRGRYLYFSRNNTFVDNSWSYEPWGAPGGEQGVCNLRDMSANNLFLRDSVFVGMVSHTGRNILLSQSGSVGGTAGPNWWVSCVFKNYADVNGYGCYLQDGTPNGGGAFNCVFATRDGTPLVFGSSSGFQLRHCTLYAGGTSQALRYIGGSVPATGRMAGNAYLARLAGNCAGVGGALFTLPLASPYSADSSYFGLSDSTYAFQKHVGGLACYRPSQWAVTTGAEQHSQFASLAGLVADTSWATLDLTPTATSALLNARWPGGYAGARQAGQVSVVTDPGVTEPGYPRFYLKAGADQGGSVKWWPYLNIAGSAIDTTSCRYYSRFPMVTMNAEFADSAGTLGKLASLSAMQTVRTMNPSARLVAWPWLDAAYLRSGPDTANVYSYVFQQWRAVRDAGGGWASGSGSAAGPSTPADSAGSRGFLWNKVPGYRGNFFGQVYGGGFAGNTMSNVNLAWQPSPGVFPVCDSLVQVYLRHFVKRQHLNGTYVWDGIVLDLAIPEMRFYDTPGDSVDYVRAGYATHALLDTAWTQANVYIMHQLRLAAAAAGRPNFIIAGNGAGGIAFEDLNGWSRENWPNLQGGSWSSNFNMFGFGSTLSGGSMAGGGSNADVKFMQRPQINITAATPGVGDSLPAGTDTTSATRKLARWQMGTAALTGSLAAITVGSSSDYYGGQLSGTGQERYWFDEYAVDTTTAQAVKDYQHQGWLGNPLDHWYNTTRLINGTDLLNGAGDFEAGVHQSNWTLTNSASGVASMVSDTVHTGSGALRIRVLKPGAVYTVAASATQRIISTGTPPTVTFWARASSPRPVMVALNGVTSVVERGSWNANGRLWIGTNWQPYRVSELVAAGIAESLTVAFWCADTTGTIWIDDMTFQKGLRRPSYVREFDRGIVVVNPNTVAETLTAVRPLRKLKALAGASPDINNGASIGTGSTYIVPGTDALFLLYGTTVDNQRPAPVTTLAISSRAPRAMSLNWTQAGDDSLAGTATSVTLRYSSAGTITEGNWASATTVTGVPAPGPPGSLGTWTVTGLSPSTAYWFAIKTTDDAGQVSAISNVPTASTTGMPRTYLIEGK